MTDQRVAESAATEDTCPDCRRNVFHNRHTTAVEEEAHTASLVEALRVAVPVTPSQDEQATQP